MRYTEMDLAWAAGLFVGEGSVTISRKPGGYAYLFIQISMKDYRPIERFAAIFDQEATWVKVTKKDYKVRKMQATGRRAETILALLWPHLKGTDKGDEVLLLATHLGVQDWITERRTENRPRVSRH